MFIKFLSEIRAVYAIMRKNVIEPDRQQMTIHIDAEKMRFAFRITKGRRHTNTHTHTHSYLLLLAFEWQKWLHERAINGTLYVHCVSC